MARCAGFLETDEYVRRIFSVAVLCVVQQSHGNCEVGGVATERSTQFLAISAEAIVVLEEIVKLVSPRRRPEGIEGLLENGFSSLRLTHRLVDRDLPVDNPFTAIGKAIFVFAQQTQRFLIIAAP